MWKEFERMDTAAVWQMEEFVRSHPKGHFMQMPQWAQVKPYWKWRGILVYREKEVAAAISILIRPLALGFSLMYVPRGPVSDREDMELWKEIMDALKQIARKHHAIMLYTDPDEPDSNEAFRGIMEKLRFQETSNDGFGNIQPQYVFRLDLENRKTEEIFGAFTPKTRYNIGLSQRKGVNIREYAGSDEIPEDILPQFYELMQTTGERDHFYIRGEDYFRGLLDALQADARILIAYLHDQPIAGAIEVFCGRKAWYLYGASAYEHRNAMPNYLLQWTMIRRAIERGCTLYDFRGVPGEVSEKHPLYGLYRFKKGFSGTYTKFTGLFSYQFRPACCAILQIAMKLRRSIRTETRKD